MPRYDPPNAIIFRHDFTCVKSLRRIALILVLFGTEFGALDYIFVHLEVNMTVSTTKSEAIKSEFSEYIKSGSFPCVGAKSALAQDAIEILIMDDFSDERQDLGLYLELLKYGENLDLESPVIRSFAAIYSKAEIGNEVQFEALLWKRLRAIHKLDASLGRPWDKTTDSDPHSAKFSMSIGETSFFVIGLHPKASRAARRFKYPTFIFNSTAQFAKLRADGRFKKLQSIIRERDVELDGEINPMLDDFGDRSEARQYSGRQVSDNWKPPFKSKEHLNVPKQDKPKNWR
jgi:FPC/CPF motif-containing protein YcgG